MFLDYKLERDEGNCKSPRLDTSLKKTLIDDESDVAHLVEEPGWVLKTLKGVQRSGWSC